MKKLNKLTAVLLSLALCLSLAAPAFAAEDYQMSLFDNVDSFEQLENAVAEVEEQKDIAEGNRDTLVKLDKENTKDVTDAAEGVDQDAVSNAADDAKKAAEDAESEIKSIKNGAAAEAEEITGDAASKADAANTTVGEIQDAIDSAASQVDGLLEQANAAAAEAAASTSAAEAQAAADRAAEAANTAADLAAEMDRQLAQADAVVQDAEAAVAEAQERYDDLVKEAERKTEQEKTEALAEIDEAEKALTEAQAKLNAAQEQYDKLADENGEIEANIQAALNAAEAALEAAKDADLVDAANAKDAIEDVQEAAANALENAKTKKASADKGLKAANRLSKYENKGKLTEEDKAQLNSLVAETASAIRAMVDEAQKAHESAIAKNNAAKKAFEAAKAAAESDPSPENLAALKAARKVKDNAKAKQERTGEILELAKADNRTLKQLHKDSVTASELVTILNGVSKTAWKNFYNAEIEKNSADADRDAARDQKDLAKSYRYDAGNAYKEAKAKYDAMVAAKDAYKAAQDAVTAAQASLDEAREKAEGLDTSVNLEAAAQALKTAQANAAQARADYNEAAQAAAEAAQNAAGAANAASQAAAAIPYVPGGDNDGGDGADTPAPEVEIIDEAVPLASGPVTRAQFIDYLWRHEGEPEGAACTFADVAEDHEYVLALGWAQANGIAVADADGNFQPDELVTVAAVREFLGNFASVFGTNAVNVADLATLTGADDEAVLNCDEVLAEFFGEEYILPEDLDILDTDDAA